MASHLNSDAEKIVLDLLKSAGEPVPETETTVTTIPPGSSFHTPPHSPSKEDKLFCALKGCQKEA